MKHIILTALIAVSLAACEESSALKEKRKVNSQQEQYQTAQPIPAFDWSLERENLIKLYKLRNKKVATHTVWRSNTGVVEGDCASIGFGLPYDTSLTNPLVSYGGQSKTSIGQAEPNGIFASTNTAATWVLCVGLAGTIEPIYVESKVTTYPYSVKINYKTNRITKHGEATAILD